MTDRAFQILLSAFWGLAAAGLGWYCLVVAQQITYVTLADGRQQERRLPLIFRLLLPLAPNLGPLFETNAFEGMRMRVAGRMTSAGFEDLLERLVTACPDPVIAADLRGNLLVFSRAAEAILGYEAREVLDGRLHVSELYAEPDDAARIMKAMKASEDRAAIGVQVRLRTRRGEAVPVHLSSSLVHDFAGRIVASVGIFRDERHSHELAMRLASATDQLVASEKRAATVAVAGATAHELNQPLTSVMGIVELLRLDKELPEKVQDRMERAYVQLDRMAEIVRNLSQVTGYGTKPYTDGQEILDLDKQ